MTNEDAIKWLENLRQDIGQLRHEDLWHYEQAIVEIIELLEEQEEKLKFLDALFNYINPNDMEKYMRMYRSLPVPSDGRSVK